MACDQHETEYWLETTRLEMMKLNLEKMQHVFKPMELMCKEELHCLREYLRRHTGKEDI